MSIYYCVTEAYYDNGRVTANITMSMEAESKPEDTSKSLRDRDIYCTWYETKEEADQAVNEARAISSF